MTSDELGDALPCRCPHHGVVAPAHDLTDLPEPEQGLNPAHAPAPQVPPPVDELLPWETVGPDGSIVSAVAEDGDGSSLVGAALGLLWRGLGRLASAAGRKLHVA